MISSINSVTNSYSRINERKNFYPGISFCNINFEGVIKVPKNLQDPENNKILTEMVNDLKIQNVIISEKKSKSKLYRHLEYNDNNSSTLDILRNFLQKYKIKFIETKDKNFSLYIKNKVPKKTPVVINTKRELRQMNLMKAGKDKPVNLLSNDFIFPSKADLWNKFADNLKLPENSYLLDDNGKVDFKIKVLKYLYEQWSPNRDLIVDIRQDKIAQAVGSNYPVISSTIKFLKEQGLVECYRNKNNSYNYKIASKFFEIATGDKKFNTAKFQFSIEDLSDDQFKIINSKIEKYKNEKIITEIIEDRNEITIEFDHNKAFKNEEIFELKPLLELISRFNIPATLSIPSRHIKTNFQFAEGILVKFNPDNEMLETSKKMIYENSFVQIVNTPEFVQKMKLEPSDHLILKYLLLNIKPDGNVLVTNNDLIKDLDLTLTIVRSTIKSLEEKGILEKKKKHAHVCEFTKEFLDMINIENSSNKAGKIFANVSCTEEVTELAI